MIIISDGRIQAQGTRAELLPQTDTRLLQGEGLEQLFLDLTATA